MGLMQGTPPPVEPATFQQIPYQERLKILSRHWAEYGFGAPKITAVVYIVKLLAFYMAGGLAVATLTSGLNPLEVEAWWREPIVWQKLVIWTVLLESLGLAGSWGPLAGHFKPMTAGVRYYANPGTVRVAPWPTKVPFTGGDTRTPADVGLYLAYIGALMAALVLPGSADGSVTDAIGANEGLVSPALILLAVGLLGVLGLRDKILFLAARSEQYVPALLFFAFLPFVDMVVAAKVLIVAIWMGAAFSKITRHFANVIPPMVSNTPWLSSKAVKRMHYRSFPEDLRPSERATGLAHVGGTLVEMGAPLVLLLSGSWELTVAAAVLMICFHVFITSTFPLAVPLEWNVMFMFITAWLFLGHPNHEGYGLGDIDPVLLAVLVPALLVLPVLGNLRPDLVSFLPSLRQYSGNWASALWALAPGAEDKIDACIRKPAKMQKRQLVEMGMYDEEMAEVVMQQPVGWRAMHSQGRGLNSLLLRHLGDDLDRYSVREGEFCCNVVAGFNFGDGHMHDETLLQAVQRRCNFAPGELVVAWVESEPAFHGRQEYFVWDAAEGVVERGSWSVAEAVAEQPWLPNGPIPLEVAWRKPGYEPGALGTGLATRSARELVPA